MGLRVGVGVSVRVRVRVRGRVRVSVRVRARARVRVRARTSRRNSSGAPFIAATSQSTPAMPMPGKARPGSTPSAARASASRS